MLRSKVLKNPAVIFAIIALLGFVPWARILSLEIRNYKCQLLFNESGWVALFLLLCVVMINLMQQNKWYSGLAMLLIPVVLLAIVFIILLSLFDASQWQDLTVYKNGDDYLILQGITYGRDDVNGHRRLIQTNNPDAGIRPIKEFDLLTSDWDKFEGNEVLYLNKRWKKRLSTTTQ